MWSLLSHANNLTCALRGVVPRPTRFFYSQAKLRRISAITTTTGREIIEKLMEVAVLVDLTSPITPHSLRRYSVTMVYEATGDLKLAQEFAEGRYRLVTHLADFELGIAFSNKTSRYAVLINSTIAYDKLG